jgi:methionine-rich copper-binding protein CopC
MMKGVTLVFASLLTMAAAFDAGAHAFLDHATPAVGSAIHGSPAEVRLWFTQGLEPAFSTVQVETVTAGGWTSKTRMSTWRTLRCCRSRCRNSLPAGTAWYGGRSRSTPMSPKVISRSTSCLDCYQRPTSDR